MFVGFIIFLMLCVLFKGYVKKYAIAKLNALKGKTFFGGFIKGQTLGYLKVSVACCVYFGTLDMGMFKDHWRIFLPKLTPFFLVVAWPIGITIVLLYCKKHLGKPIVRGKIGQAYLGIDLKRGNWAIAKYPIFLLRRFVFVMIPVIYRDFPWHQI